MSKPIRPLQRLVCAVVSAILMLQPVGAATYQYNVHVPGFVGPAVSPGTGDGNVDIGEDAVRAKLRLSTSRMDFRAVLGEAPITQRSILLNDGTGPAVLSGIASTSDFSVSSDCVSPLAPGAGCTLTTTFTPQEAGDFDYRMTVSAVGAKVPVSLLMVASVTTPESAPPGPRLLLATDLVDFGIVEPGEVNTRSVMLRNVGDETAQLSGIEAGGEFAVSSDCPAALQPNGACELTAQFSSFVPNGHMHVMQLRAAPAAPEVSVTLYASVRENPAVVPALSFAKPILVFAAVGADGVVPGAKQATVLMNKGTAPAVLAGIVSNNDFEVWDDCPSSLPVGASCNVTAELLPSAVANAQYLMVVKAQGNALAQLLMMGPGTELNPGGTEKPPVLGLAFAPAGLDFGAQPVGQSATLSATLENQGEAAVPLAGLTLPYGGDYAQQNNCGKTLAAGGTCQVQVTFTPKAAGDQVGVVQAGKAALRLSGTGVQARLRVGPDELNFGAMLPGTTVRQVLNVANSGNEDLTGLRMPAPAAPFVLESTTCTTTLEAYQGCSVTLRVTAAVLGDLSGSLRLSSTNGGAATVPLSGQVVQVKASPSALAFPDTRLSTSALDQSVTLTNEGPQAVALQLGVTAGAEHFNQSNNCGAQLAGGASCKVAVRFTPAAEGALQGEVGIASGSVALARISLAGKSFVPRLTLSQTGLSFEDTNVGKTAAKQSVTVTNDTDTNVAITGLGIASGASDFGQSNNCGTQLAAAASCTVDVQMTPTVGGARSGTLGLETSLGQYAVSLTGTGTVPDSVLTGPDAPEVTPPAPGTPDDGYTHYTIKFLETEFGESSAVRNVVFSNVGTGPLAITGISMVKGMEDFAQSNNCGAKLAPGASCTIAMRFTPSAAGPRTGAIALHSETGNYLFNLLGTGAAASGVWTANTSADFGFVEKGSSALRNFTFTNTGNSAARNLVTTVVGEGLTLVANTCGSLAAAATVEPGYTCSATVRYAPTDYGTLTGGMLATTGVIVDSPAQLPLTGSAPEPSIAFDALSGDFGEMRVGATVSRTFTLRNTSKLADIVQAVPTSSNEAFEVAGGTCTTGLALAANAACTVIVKATPMVGGALEATVTASSGKGSTAAVALTVVGVSSAYSLSGDASGVTAPNQRVQTSSLAIPRYFNVYLRDEKALSVVSASKVTLSGSSAFTLTGLDVVSSVDTKITACPFDAQNSAATCSAKAAGQLIRVQVKFQSSVAGDNSTKLRIEHNGVEGAHELDLTGAYVYSSDPYDSNVTMMLHMDGTPGSSGFVDSKGNAVTVRGAPTLVAGSPVAGTTAGSFNGTNQGLTLKAGLLDFRGDDFTVESWVYPRRLTGGQEGYEGLIGGGWGFHVYFRNSAIGIQSSVTGIGPSYPESPLTSPTGSVPLNVWTHFAVVRQGSSLAIYINGVKSVSRPLTRTLAVQTNPTSVGYLNFEPGGEVYPYYGNSMLDEVRVTKGIARYTGNFTPNTAPLPN